MLRRFITSFCCMLVGCFIFCFAQAESNTYYVITHGSQDPYWARLFNGAKAAANNLGIKLQILAPSGANDIPTQIQFLNSAIATKPLGIAITIPSDTAFSESLIKAKKNGIPVIAIDTQPMKSKKANPFLAFVGVSNYLYGKSCAKRALKSKKITDRVLIANPQPGHIGLEERAKGVKDVLTSKGIIVDELDAGVDPAQVQQKVKSYFIKHPKTSAIFCLTAQTLDPIGQMILHSKKIGFKYHPLVFSFDITSSTAKFIENGIVQATMDQQPFYIGYFSIEQLVLFNKYQLHPVNISTAAGYVDKTNIKELIPLVDKGVR